MNQNQLNDATTPRSVDQQQACSASCTDCGLDYNDFGVDLVLADQDWRKLAPDDGLLCATCICRRAKKTGGVSLLAWIRNA